MTGKYTLHTLQAAIDYTFRDQSLILEALTHRSYLNECDDPAEKDNERLEFFGDAVLDFVLSEMLLQRFRSSREGELTKLRASLVDEDRLALAAQQIGLGAHLRLGRGEERSGGREKKSVLADAYEALLAAVYLDGGLEPVRRLVQRHVEFLLTTGTKRLVAHDYKTEFQEMVQSRLGLTPHYLMLHATGPDHDRTFAVSAVVGTETYGEGRGRSKKEAEQNAARDALQKLRKMSP